MPRTIRLRKFLPCSKYPATAQTHGAILAIFAVEGLELGARITSAYMLDTDWKCKLLRHHGKKNPKLRLERQRDQAVDAAARHHYHPPQIASGQNASNTPSASPNATQCKEPGPSDLNKRSFTVSAISLAIHIQPHPNHTPPYLIRGALWLDLQALYAISASRPFTAVA